jgi:hypothetical protein
MTVTQRSDRRIAAWALIWGSLGVLVAALQQALTGLIGGDRWNWAWMVGHATGLALAWPFGWWLGVRAVARGLIPQSPARRARDERLRVVRRAIAAGALPTDAEPSWWRAALRSEIRELRLATWIFAGLCAVAAGLVGASAVIANDNAVGVWAVAVFLVTVPAVAVRWIRSQLRVARRLQASVEQG